MELEHELSRENPSVDRVGETLEKDIGMSAKVLQLVNSAFFGLHEHVARPSQAVALLGVNTVKSLVLAFHVFESWGDRVVAGFDSGRLWEHSLDVAIIARSIAEAEALETGIREDTHIAGMFHDIGKLILADNLPDSCEAIERLILEKGAAPLDAEREVLGATHAETGAYLLALWGFPDNVVHAVAFHHAPCQIPTEGINPAMLVHVANALHYERKGIPVSPAQRIDEECLEAHGLKDHLPKWRQLLLAKPK
jgi:putative nucleotidyltransferase with HDIG domain